MVLYDYEAVDHSELSITQGQTAQIISVSGDWTLVSVNGGQGLVPSAYISTTTSRSASPIHSKSLQCVYEYTAIDNSELSFIAGDVIDVIESGEVEADAWWEGKNQRTGEIGVFCLAFTQGWEMIVSTCDISRKTSLVRDVVSRKPSLVRAISGSFDVQVLFDFEPSCEGELKLQGISIHNTCR